MRSPETSSHKRAGFTLVEIVAVVSILVSIGFVLQPVVQRAAENARRAACQDNLRKIGVALWMYAGDWNYYIPSPRLTGYTGTQFSNQVAEFCSRVGQIPPAQGVAPVTYAECLSPYLGSRDVFFCPSDNTNTNSPTDMCSYFYRPALAVAALNGKGNKGSLAYQSSQITFFDRKAFHSGDAGKGWTIGIRLNCVFADGHVAYVISDPNAVVKPGSVGSATIDCKWCWTQSQGFPCWYNAKGDSSSSSTPSGQTYDGLFFKDATR